MQAQCFVIMPFGKKTDSKGREIDFKFVYDSLIKPAILKANLQPIIAYEEQTGGIIHKPMYERIMFCEFSITDMTTFNANVFYELGMRHGIKPYTTVVICDEGMGPLPFDVALIRTLMYKYQFDKDKNEMTIENLDAKVDALAGLLDSNNVTNPVPDSPVQQTIAGFPFPDLQNLRNRSESFKKFAAESQELIESIHSTVDEWEQLCIKEKYAEQDNDQEKAKQFVQSKLDCLEKIKKIDTDLGLVKGREFSIMSTLLMAYRAMGANQEMVNLIQKIPTDQFDMNMTLQQQLAHAYNQLGNYDKAETLLLAIENKFGKHPETNGLLGSVYKKKAKSVAGRDQFAEKGFLKKAITCYKDGFDADPSDYYPGTNLLNLLFTTKSDSELYKKYLPLVAYAVERKVQQQPNDYWCQASGMELEILRGNAEKAGDYLAAAKACRYFPWETGSTLDSLKRIRKQMETDKSGDIGSLDQMISSLSS